MSLPWDNQPPLYWEKDIKSAKNTLEEVFRIVSPDLGIFTIPNTKRKALHRVVDDSYDWDKEFEADIDIPNDPGVESKSPLYTDCAVGFGFEVPEAEGDPIKSVRHWSRYRFSSPKDSILFLRVFSHYAELLKRERKEAKRKAAEQERLQERKKAEAKRKINEQEKLKQDQSERHPVSYPASSQREEKERLEWEKLERRWSEEKAERYRRALRLLQPPS